MDENIDLVETINVSSVECLNENPDFPIANAIFQPNTDLCVQSLDDPQLLIKMAFDQPVKIASIAIYGSADDQTAPSEIKLFTGNPNLGFSEAESDVPVQTLTLSEKDITEGRDLPLRFVKFQGVTVLAIFVANNLGGDVSKIGRLVLKGQKTVSVDMKEWKGTKGPMEGM